MSKASDTGKSFMAGVFAKLPESVRAQVETAFNMVEAEQALEIIGAGALARPEINKKFDELKVAQDKLAADQQAAEEFAERQKVWWDTHEPKVREYDRVIAENAALKAGSGTGGTGGTGNGHGAGAPSVEDLKKEFDEKLALLQREGLGVMAYMSSLSAKHLKEFGEEPDMTALLADTNLGKPMPDGRIYGLVQAYATKYEAQIKARAEKAETARIDKLVEERFAERMKGMAHPFPLRDAAPSVLDVLESTTDKSENHTVDSATALYEQLQSARGT